jgi:hypothetical protein
MTASTCRTSFAISILLTQSSTVIMPRRPMIIFNETVIAGTVLFLILFLKSSTRSAAVEKISSTAGGVLHGPAILKFRSALDWGRANRPDLLVRAVSRSPLAALELFFDGLPVDIADWCCESTSRVVSKSMGRPAYSRGPKLDRARCCPTMLARYRFRARRHVPGLTPTACLKIRVR